VSAARRGYRFAAEAAVGVGAFFEHQTPTDGSSALNHSRFRETPLCNATWLITKADSTSGQAARASCEQQTPSDKRLTFNEKAPSRALSTPMGVWSFGARPPLIPRQSGRFAAGGREQLRPSQTPRKGYPAAKGRRNLCVD
jgi:hypothetical protein